MSEQHPWEQMEDEPNTWFERFTEYMMSDKRSVLAIYNKHRKAKAERTGKKYTPAKSPPSSWSKASHDFNWVARADAFYAYQQQKKIEQYEDERLKAKNARVQVVKAITSILGKVLARYVDRPGQPATPPPDEKELRILADAISKILDQNRIEFGEPTSYNNLDVTSGGEKIQSNISIDNLSEMFQKIREIEKKSRESE